MKEEASFSGTSTYAEKYTSSQSISLPLRENILSSLSLPLPPYLGMRSEVHIHVK
jgi:hypothetical protein